MKNRETRKIVLAGLFAAIAGFLKLNTLMIGTRIGIYELPLLIGGFFLGPVYGLMIGFVADTIYAVILGYSWSLYTIPTMLIGFYGGLIPKLKFKKNIISFIIFIPLALISQTSLNLLARYVEVQDWGPVLINLALKVWVQLIKLPILIVSAKILTEKLKVLEINYNQ